MNLKISLLLSFCLVGAMPALVASPYRIMVVGDSISVGYTDNPNWTVPFEFGFRSGLYTRLTNSGMAFQFVGSSQEPWNGGSAGTYGVPTNTPTLDLRPIGQDHCEGYGGKKTDFMLANISSWLTAHSPDVILLMAGINDIKSGETNEPTVAEQNLSNIVFTVTANAPDTRLIVAQITPRANYTLGIVKYNHFIREALVPHFAAQGRHVTTVDQYTNLLVAGTTNIDAAIFSNGINHPNAVAYDRMAETWFQGIQSLTLPPAQPPPPKNLLTNGGFEAPLFTTNNTHNINPVGSGWTFTVGNPGAGSGIDRGNPYNSSSGSASFDGLQQAFLQSAGNSTTSRIAQAVSGFIVGKYYQLSFGAKGITGYQGANPFRARLMDGATVTPLFGGSDIVPGATNYTAYVSEPFRATSTTMTLEFSDHALNTVQKVSWIDAVNVFAVPAVSINGFMDGGLFKVQFSGFTNITYNVVATDDDASPMAEWPLLGMAQHLSNEVFEFTDTQTSNHLRRFYRVQETN